MLNAFVIFICGHRLCEVFCLWVIRGCGSLCGVFAHLFVGLDKWKGFKNPFTPQMSDMIKCWHLCLWGCGLAFLGNQEFSKFTRQAGCWCMEGCPRPEACSPRASTLVEVKKDIPIWLMGMVGAMGVPEVVGQKSSKGLDGHISIMVGLGCLLVPKWWLVWGVRKRGRRVLSQRTLPDH